MKWVGLVILIIGFGLTPDPPDYSDSNNWAALPDRADAADKVPANSGLTDNQDDAAVDVFFIHPTTYYRSYSGNADVNDKRLNEFTDRQTIATQASVFNGSARVYAPRYRQAALHNFFKRDASKSKKAFDIAYSDVRAAFKYYLEHYNHGRPIIIAGHSQGSMHGARLIREFFDGTDRQSQLVAAYLIGYAVREDEFSFIRACDSPGQTGCVISYNSFGWDARPRYQDFDNAICVNPLSWRKDGPLVGRDAHKGAVPRSFEEVDRNMISCQCTNHVLWITKPKERDYVMMGGKNYHMVDYNLFYVDIRENVAERVAAYMKAH